VGPADWKLEETHSHRTTAIDSVPEPTTVSRKVGDSRICRENWYMVA
jgi:hypothetical protein